MQQHWKRCFDLDIKRSKRQRTEGGPSEVFSIGKKVKLHCENNYLSIRLMTSKLRCKGNMKYWKTLNGINMLIVIMLDLCHNVEKGGELKLKFLTCLNFLYDHYQGKLNLKVIKMQ
ncbi:hypothetical protein Ahy_A10g050118 [Arachis hypogaea]|uniref:Uncharacterized protein n=1 Tax=Arachis hypogaea TaxID=3818 RepID=A0A445B8L7_ARAHY|nr:hypothetical protein Ahy_A10g050118 [Arachis hypogaea]